MDCYRYSGRSFEEQSKALEEILSADRIVRAALEAAHALGLPDWLIVSGAIYNTVWNHLTGRPAGHGVKDIDLFYCDGGDLSWEAEDAVIRRGEAAFADLPVPVEIRNQARVHLWYPDRFGRECPAYRSSAESLRYFASRTHAVGVHLDTRGRLAIEAPFGLDDMFSLRVTPNHALDNRATHEEKGRRAQRNWTEVILIPW